MEIADKFIDAVICGKVLLQKAKWEISFICNFCEKTLPTLPELLRHALSEHVEDSTTDMLEKLCATETKQEVDEDSDACDSMLQEILECQEQDDMDEEILRHFMNKTSDSDDECLKEEIRTTPTEISDVAESSGSESDAEDDSSNTQFEFLDVSEKKRDDTESKPKRICKISTTRQCEICDAKFNRIKQLRIHKQNEHGESAFICRQCGTGFVEKRSWIFHEMRHKGIKPHPCKICNKTFTTRDELLLHVRRHTGEHPYKCSYCDKTFVSSPAVIAHTRTHTKERPYLCPICGKSFSASYVLKTHITTHSSERPHKCSHCSASFKNRAGLRQHVQIHAEVKKYSCKFCGKLFAQKAGVTSHLKCSHKYHPNNHKLIKA